MTVHERMRWGLSAITVLTLAIAFAAISVVLDRYQERQLDAALLAIARAEAEEAPANHFSFSSRPGPAANDVGPLEKYGIIFDRRDGVLAATPPFDAAGPILVDLRPPDSTPFDFTFATRAYRGVVVPIPGYGDRTLLLAASREDLDGDSRFVRKAMAVALAVSIAWLLGAIGWLVRRNMREHDRIAEVLHRIATGDVDARISNAVSDEQLRRVGGDIDEIAGKLAVLVGNQRRFIAHAAHELRSPLSALHGEIQQALRRERTAEEYRSSLAFLLRASARLKHLAEQLLDLARAELVPVTVDSASVATVFADVVESVDALAREKELTITSESTDCEVAATPADLARILRNLLDNAIRHSPLGGVVHLEVEPGDTTRILVQDDGAGVLEAERERVFEPFHRSRLDRANTFGAGLGLAIARELARKHGGDLVVGVEPSCFVLSLPRVLRGE